MRVGVYQCAAGVVATETRLAELAVQAEGVDLLICPELFLSGYHAQAPALAEPRDGPFGQAVARIAKQAGVAIAYGYPEAAAGRVYNAAALYDRSGALIATHRKRLPSPGSFEDAGFDRGGCATFADLLGWRVAIIICYEVEFPEILRHAARSGAEFVIVPTALGADWGVVAEHLVPTRAYENGLWIAYADHTGVAEGIRFFGGSRVVGPDGKAYAVGGQGAGRITATLDKAEVQRMRARIPFLRDCADL